MQKLLLAAGTALALAGCTSPALRNDTYKTIQAQAAAAAKPAPVQPEEAVANALLPPVATLATQLPKARPALEERFNVHFNNVPAQQFFNSLVAGTRYNMIVHPEVSGNITANLKDVTMAEALDAVREMYGFDYQITGNRVSIKPLTMQTRMFHINYLIGNRKGLSNLRVNSTSVSSTGTNGNNQNQNQNQNQQQQQQQNSSGQGGNDHSSLSQSNQSSDPSGQNAFQNMPQTDSNGVRTQANNDFWVDLRTAIETLVGSTQGGRSVVISPQSGLLVVRAMPQELRSIDLYLKATQLAVDRQVILEAKILEVELNDSYQSGINWASFASFKTGHQNRVSGGFLQPGAGLQPLPFDGSQPPVIAAGNLIASAGYAIQNAAQAGGSLFGLAFQTSNFAALISFLESQGTVHVLSSPRIATMNNQKAVLKIGTDEFFVTGVTTTTNNNAVGNTVTPSVTLTPFFSGVVLDVTPQIDEKGNVLLHVHPSVSQVTTVNKGINLGTAGSLSLPLAASSTSEIDSMVRGQDGKVVALGGLMRQSSTGDNSQVPTLGSVPVLGNLFKNKAQTNQKRELVVLIKPTIVDSNASWNQDMLDTSRRIDELDPQGRK
jgi:MSHA biogenesis protein MshL